MPDRRDWENRSDHRPLITVAADVAPAEEPFAVRSPRQAGLDLTLSDPVVGLREAVRVGVGGGVEAGEGSDVELGLRGPLVR